MSLAACTIVSKNYLPFARVLARSFADLHPEGRFFVLLVDRIDGRFDKSEEAFELIEVEELQNIPALRSFLFKYNQLECNTAVKPYFLEHLFERFGLDSLLYFDPDILVLTELEPLARHLDHVSIVLTPHLTEPIDDGMFPDELAILRAGSYNLGFIGLRSTETTRRFLTWWQKRVYEQCVERPERGLFVDQKWIDLVPGMFPDVHILTEPGYNVAYWNVMGRTISLDGEPTANGEPLYFFHFSGIQPEAMDLVSKHQDRLVLSDLGQGKDLYLRYRELLLQAGYADLIGWPYAFAHFDNDVAIPSLARALYLTLGSARERFGDPFSTGHKSFFRWLNQPARFRPTGVPYLSHLLEYLYARRPELHRRFPDPGGRDLSGYARWLADFGQQEQGLAPVFLEPSGDGNRTPIWTPSGIRRRLHMAVSRAKKSAAGRRLAQWSKRTLGAARTERFKEKIRPAAQPALRLGGQLRLIPSVERPGINLVGYLEAETGMGQGARGIASALQTTHIPVSPHSLKLNVEARSQDPTFGPVQSDFPFDVNLFFVNADQVDPVRQHIGAEVFNGRYDIGFWLWELSQFPAEFQPCFRHFHEIWTPSTFCVEALSAVAPVPVRRVPLPIAAPPPARHGRQHFDLPEGAFVVLFVFDFLSHVERKNPDAVIEAFRQAFPESEDAILVLKASHTDHDADARQRLEAAAEDKRIRFLPAEMSRPEVLDLMRACDAYISLHRSEGYGLTLAEAMSLDKPVIATSYSGSTDFIRPGTGLPVRYRLVELQGSVGPYPPGAVWAEADVNHAAELLRWVYANPDAARELGRAGGDEIRTEYSMIAVGRILEDRFAHLLRTASAGHLDRAR